MYMLNVRGRSGSHSSTVNFPSPISSIHRETPTFAPKRRCEDDVPFPSQRLRLLPRDVLPNATEELNSYAESTQAPSYSPISTLTSFNRDVSPSSSAFHSVQEELEAADGEQYAYDANVGDDDPDDLTYLPVDEDEDAGQEDLSSGDESIDQLDLEEYADDDNVQRTAEYLYRLLQRQDEFGCGPARHTTAHRQHVRSTSPGNHHPLRATYRSPQPFSRIVGRCPVGLDSDTWSNRRGEPRKNFIPAPALHTLFEGCAREQLDGEETQQGREIFNVCLHKEHVPDIVPSLEFDVDSVFVFPATLGAFKKGMRFSFVQQNTYNLTKSVHLKWSGAIPCSDGALHHRKVPLHRIPHLYIGTLDEVHHSTIFVFFPGLVRPECHSSYLGPKDAMLFFDEVLYKACQNNTSVGVQQHLPPEYVTADLKAKAKGVEHQSLRYERGLRQHRNYYIHAEHLTSIWSDVLTYIDIGGHRLEPFRDAFLCVNSKNLKLDFKKGPSLSHTLGYYRQRMDDTFETELCHRYSDVAKEICPSDAIDPEDMAQPFTYLWRECCLRAEYNNLVTGPFEGKGGIASFYHPGFLRDTASMTIVPPVTSWIGRGGWVYGQWYSSMKEIGDAQQTHLFDNERLVHLALDEDVYKSAFGARNALFADSRQTLIRGYQGCKQRVKQSFQAYRGTSFGGRIEFRISKAVEDRIYDLSLYDDNPLEQSPRPLHSFWAIPTPVVVEFMLGNYNKFSALFEIAMATSSTTGVSLQQTQLMVGLIKCLQRFGSSRIGRDPLLYVDRRRSKGKVQRGLGLEASMKESGYGWFASMVDWTALQFVDEVAEQLVGFSPDFLRPYQNRVRAFQDVGSLTRTCFDYLSLCQTTGCSPDKALGVLAHLCLRQYRRDVLDALDRQNDLRPAYNVESAKDTVYFSLEGLAGVVVSPPALVKGNRGKVRTPDQMAEWIFGTGPEFSRKHFGTNKPFRILCEKVDLFVKTYNGLFQDWRQCLKNEFFRFHWLIPYPDGNGTLIATAKETGARQYWAVGWHQTEHHYFWAKGVPRQGLVPRYPETLTMDTTTLRAYLQAP